MLRCYQRHFDGPSLITLPCEDVTTCVDFVELPKYEDRDYPDIFSIGLDNKHRYLYDLFEDGDQGCDLVSYESLPSEVRTTVFNIDMTRPIAAPTVGLLDECYSLKRGGLHSGLDT